MGTVVEGAANAALGVCVILLLAAGLVFAGLAGASLVDRPAPYLGACECVDVPAYRDTAVDGEVR